VHTCMYIMDGYMGMDRMYVCMYVCICMDMFYQCQIHPLKERINNILQILYEER